MSIEKEENIQAYMDYCYNFAKYWMKKHDFEYDYMAYGAASIPEPTWKDIKEWLDFEKEKHKNEL